MLTEKVFKKKHPLTTIPRDKRTGDIKEADEN